MRAYIVHHHSLSIILVKLPNNAIELNNGSLFAFVCSNLEWEVSISNKRYSVCELFERENDSTFSLLQWVKDLGLEDNYSLI